MNDAYRRSRSPRRTCLVTTLVALAAGAMPAQAQQLVKVGGEFRVNTTTAGDQGDADVTFEDDGTFVVVWRESDADSIHAQRLDWSGSPVGGEVTIAPSNSTAPVVVAIPLPASGSALAKGLQNDPARSANVLWGDYLNVDVRAASANLNPVPVTLDTSVSGTPPPEASTQSSSPGGYIAVYRTTDDKIKAQRFDFQHQSIGSTLFDAPASVQVSVIEDLGPVFILLAREPEDAFEAEKSATLRSEGLAATTTSVAYLVAYLWEDATSGASLVSGRFFDDMDNQIGAEVLISDPADLTFKADLAMAVNDSGLAMAAWRTGLTSPKVVMRLVDAQGPGPGIFLLSSDQVSQLRFPDVAATGDRFLVTWEKEPFEVGGFPPFEIVGRFLDVSNPLAPTGGTEIRFSGAGDWDRRRPAIAADDQGRAVVVWESSGQDGDRGGIYAQPLELVPEGDVIFLDGFESGDATAWSSQAP